MTALVGGQPIPRAGRRAQPTTRLRVGIMECVDISDPLVGVTMNVIVQGEAKRTPVFALSPPFLPDI